MLNAILGLLGVSVEVTVTYEALDAAAAEVLAQVTKGDAICSALSDLNGRMRAIWQGEVADTASQRFAEKLDGIEEQLKAFRSHAANLQTICRKYIQTSGEIAGEIQMLSDEVVI